MVMTCLGRNGSSNTGKLFGWSSVQCRIFQLASTCVATPWSDGSSTSIVNTLKRAAMKASVERNETVSMAAKEALRVCDLFGVPRAPPLVFVHRTVDESSVRVETSASEIIEDIQKVQKQARETRAAMEKAEKAKAQEKRQREAEREESNKRKRELKESRKEAPVQEEPPNSSASLDADKRMDMPTESENDHNMEMEADVDAGGKNDVKDTNKEKDSQNEGEESDEQPEYEEVGDDLDEDFPDIVAGGPDSDDD
jgi:hypothetical protein